MKIAIIGVGYVGLVTGACLAHLGHHLMCMDIDTQKISDLNQDKLPIYEPGLDEIILKAKQQKRIIFCANLQEAIGDADVVFIAVGTPALANGHVDIQYVEQAAIAIGQQSEKSLIVVNKSTVPVGTCQRVQNLINQELKQRGQAFTIEVLSNPEFLKEGEAITDFLKPDRILIGANSPHAFEVMRQIYQFFIEKGTPYLEMTPASAEISKYAANAMLATRISFMSELSRVTEVIGADIVKVSQAIGLDQRIGAHFLRAGCGYGGSCFPKDVRALSSFMRDLGIENSLCDKVEHINEQQKRFFVEKVIKHFEDKLDGVCLAVWGLAFKPNTDDMRMACSEVLIRTLAARRVRFQVYDPVATNTAKQLFFDISDIRYCTSAEEALEGAQALVILTEWQEFQNISPEIFKQHLPQPVVIDGRNIYDPQHMQEAGIQYISIGR